MLLGVVHFFGGGAGDADAPAGLEIGRDTLVAGKIFADPVDDLLVGDVVVRDPGGDGRALLDALVGRDFLSVADANHDGDLVEVVLVGAGGGDGHRLVRRGGQADETALVVRVGDGDEALGVDAVHDVVPADFAEIGGLGGGSLGRLRRRCCAAGVGQ